MKRTWKKLNICRTDLRLSLILCGGQSFRWKNTEPDNWIGVFRNKVWILSQEDNHLKYQCFDGSLKRENTEDENLNCSSDDENEETLKSYLRLDVDLNNLYKIWSEADPNFRKAAQDFSGIRILNQEVTENLFSFICSSNNNIKRITSMIEALCEFYGDPIAQVNDKMFKTFPTFEKLTENGVEANLRKAGFGYRAKYIHQSACRISQLGGHQWLESLKMMPYENAKLELMKLPGIGAKVADCICLMSLGHFEAVPVDTHIFQVSSNIYLPHLKKYKSLNNRIYNEISDYYRSLHGSYAGWANTVLFCSDLKLISSRDVKKEEIKKERD